MKKKELTLYVLAVIFLCVYILFSKRDDIRNFFREKQPNTIEINPFSPVLAVFSFQAGEPCHIIKTFSHYTLKLHDTKHWEIKNEEVPQLTDTLPLMISVETLGEMRDSLYLTDPLEDVVKGKYDEIIKKLCTQLIGKRPNVYFRFDPEMEVPANRFPWQENGTFYEDAFRHFFNICKTFAPQVKQVWGPAGYPGEMEFYPGDDVVDAASVTIKSDSEISLKVYPTNYPVEYELFRRLHRLRFINKPIFVFGSKQTMNDSINAQVVSSISLKINNERDIIYSSDNFKRPIINDSVRNERKLEIGLYDPQSFLNGEKPVTVEHLFADFSNLSDGTFQNRFNKVVERGHNIIVTFEPFRNPDGRTDFNVLQNVTKGKYDKEINQLYSILKHTYQTVYLRYAHEMEIPITRYPWQSQNPITYIKSYRYFMTFLNQMPATIKRVWGPAGDRGSLEWWPGNDVVDFVSIAIYGLPDKNITNPEDQESFSTIFNRKLWRFRFVDKPIFITEFGVKGSEDYQTKWLVESAKTIRISPQIYGVNYFNMYDTPKAWGEIKPPDWSISKKSFYKFLAALNGK